MFLFGLDLLYFQPQANGVPYAIEGSRIHNPDMNWGWGFRLTLGTSNLAPICHRVERKVGQGVVSDFDNREEANMSHIGDERLPKDDATNCPNFPQTCEKWGLALKWLCLPIQNDTHAHGHLLPVWSSAVQPGKTFVEDAKAHWRLHLGLVDLEWQKKWIVSPYFSMVPRLGIRFASIRQKFYVTYKGGDLFPGDEDNFNTKNKYWGLGPELGIDVRWSLGDYWSLVGSATYSGVTGGFYIHETERELISRTEHLSILDCYSMGAVIWDYIFGIQWVRGNTTLYLNWEQHFFPNQNRLIHPPITQLLGNADLAVSGLSIGGKFSF